MDKKLSWEMCLVSYMEVDKKSQPFCVLYSKSVSITSLTRITV